MDIINNYSKLQEAKLPTKPNAANPENRYWHSYKEEFNKQYENAIKGIYASNNIKNKIAISCGKEMEIFSTNKNQITQNMKRFHHPALSVALRQDSQLLASGHEDGQVQVINLRTKTQLRNFKNFKKAIYTIKFGNSIEQLYAASDEGTLKLFDIALDSVITSIPHIHSDSIRCINPLQDGTILTSSYDKTIKLFDIRTNQEAVKIFKCQNPIESILMLPNNFNFVSAQDHFTSLWDLRKDCQQKQNYIKQIQVNQKTVTSLSLIPYNDSFRILTGSLDHHIKFIRSDIFQVTNQQEWSSPISALDSTEDGQSIVIGGVDGKLQIIQSKPSKDDEEKEEEEFIPDYLKQNPHLQRKIKNYKYYNRGIYFKNENYDFKIQSQKHLKFTGYDKLLVQFKYKEAILKAYSEKQTAFIISLYEELADRGALKVAFSNLDNQELELITNYTLQKLSNPKYSNVMIAILDLLLEIYRDEIVNQELLNTLNEEIKAQNQFQQMKGMLQLILS